MMAKVVGVGGVFFKARDNKALLRWYHTHLGVPLTGEGYSVFPLDNSGPGHDGGCVVFSPFAQDTDYFGPSESPFMLNFRVDDLDALLDQLKDAGVEMVGDPQSEPYGKFAWIMDPEGNKVELWQPFPPDLSTKDA